MFARNLDFQIHQVVKAIPDFSLNNKCGALIVFGSVFSKTEKPMFCHVITRLQMIYSVT